MPVADFVLRPICSRFRPCAVVQPINAACTHGTQDRTDVVDTGKKVSVVPDADLNMQQGKHACHLWVQAATSVLCSSLLWYGPSSHKGSIYKHV